MRICRPTIAGKVPVVIGDVVDLPDGEAKFLIGIDKAELFHEEQKEPVKPKPKVETADVHEKRIPRRARQVKKS